MAEKLRRKLGDMQTDGGGWMLLYSYNRYNSAGVNIALVPDHLPSDTEEGYSHMDLEGLGFGGRQEALSSIESVRVHTQRRRCCIWRAHWLPVLSAFLLRTLYGSCRRTSYNTRARRRVWRISLNPSRH